MATQIQRRGGSTADHSSFIGADREVTVDIDKKTLVVHDGVTEGGFPLAREDLSNVTKETVLAKISSAEIFAFGCPVGVVFPYAGHTAPDGFLLLHGQTIGSLGAGADHMGDEYKAFYLFLWNNMNDAEAPIDGGRGATAEEDWDAWKKLTLPDARGRSIIGSGQGDGLTERVLGNTEGEEKHRLLVTEMPAHSHQVKEGHKNTSGIETEILTSGDDYTRTTAYLSNSYQSGSDESHNNMPPWLALTWIIKY